MPDCENTIKVELNFHSIIFSFFIHSLHVRRDTGRVFFIYSIETKANAIQLNWLQSCVNWISFRFERAFHSIDQSNKNLIFRTLLKYRKRVFSEIEIGRKVLEKLGLHNSAALHAFLHRHASHDCWRLNSSYSSHCRVSFSPRRR